MVRPIARQFHDRGYQMDISLLTIVFNAKVISIHVAAFQLHIIPYVSQYILPLSRAIPQLPVQPNPDFKLSMSESLPSKLLVPKYAELKSVQYSRELG